MKTSFVSFFLIGLWGRLIAASDNDIEASFAAGALMTFKCPAALDNPCFAPGNSVGASIIASTQAMMNDKWGDLLKDCDRRLNENTGLRGSQQQSHRHLNCADCNGEIGRAHV